MSLKKKKSSKSGKKEKCPEEISEEERLKELGIFKDEKDNEDEKESWRNYG